MTDPRAMHAPVEDPSAAGNPAGGGVDGSGFRWPADRKPAAPRGPRLPVRTEWQRLVRRLLLLGGVLVSVAIYLAPLPVGLEPGGKTAFSIFTLSTTLWVTNALPFGITGLLAVALLGLTGAMPPADAFAAFGNPAVFFLIGVFILAAALISSGLSKRCALLFLRRFEHSPYAFATGMTLAATFGTVWMPAQATTAMLFPVALEVALALRLQPKESAYAKVLFLSLAWGAMIGSTASFLGSTRAALALGMLHRAYGETIPFTNWVLAALPVVLLGALAIPLILRAVFPREAVEFSAARRVLEDSVAQLGPMGTRQWKTAIIVALTVAAWVWYGARVDLAVIALLGAVALFAAGVLKWEQAEGQIYWNIVLMYGGAIALGVVIDQTGAARWLITSVMGEVTVSPWLAVAGVATASLLLSEFMSNAAAVAVILPLAFSLGDQLGASPVALVLATTTGAGLDFALPFSSAPNTIAFASGYLRMTDVVKAGAIMTITSLLILLLVALLWWPYLGIL
jgi:sodium-dependent dicarboxylate transporter 2/3/5